MPEEPSAELVCAEPVSDELALPNADSTAQMAAGLAAKLASYDKAIVFASTQLKDELLAKQIRDRKVDFWRVARQMDKDVLTATSEAMAQRREELQELRRNIREEDARREAERQQRRDAEHRRKEQAAQKTAEEKARRDLYMSLDRPWDPKDFGQGAKALTAPVENNIREALERCRARAPPLPPDLAAMWPMFLARYAAHLRSLQGPAMGAYFINRIKNLMKELGPKWQTNPSSGSAASAGPAPPSSGGSPASAGNANAFAEFIRAQLSELVGRIKL